MATDLRLTTPEQQELLEILAGFGLFGSRLHATKYSAGTTKAGTTTRKETAKMATATRGELQQKLDQLERQVDARLAKYQRQRAAQGKGDFVFSLSKYAAEPVKIHPFKHGLTVDEFGAINNDKAKGLIEEYARSDYQLRRGGTTLADYLAGNWSTYCDTELPPHVRSACEKLQARFGNVADPNDPLAAI